MNLIDRALLSVAFGLGLASFVVLLDEPWLDHDVEALAPASLYNCSATYNQSPGNYGQSICYSGTGLQKVKLWCYNGVDYSIEYGDPVGRGVWSREWCNNMRTPVLATSVPA